MLNNIQVLRAAAALGVALAHLNSLNPSVIHLDYGTFGVELFFVISGFVMVYITARRPLSPGRFFANRLARIVPLYWLLTIGVFCLAAIAPSLLKSTQADPVELAKSLFFIPFQKGSGPIQPLLFVGWTLNYEIFFYLIFALSLWLPTMWHRVLVLSIGLTGLVAAGMAWKPQAILATFYTQPIMLEFVYGMVLGLAYPRLATVPRSIGVAAIAAGIILLPLLSQTPALFPFTAFVRGGCAALIVFGALVLQARGTVANWRPALLLGGASYALYLVHPFAFIPVEKGARALGLLEGAPLALVFVVATLAMIVAGIALHLTVEQGFQKWLKRG